MTSLPYGYALDILINPKDLIFYGVFDIINLLASISRNHRMFETFPLCNLLL